MTEKFPSPSEPVRISGRPRVLLLENIHTSATELFQAEGFDVEALYLARTFKLRIAEFPVRCRYHGGSSVNRLGDGLQMLRDLIRIRFRRH